jgi:hypothetical protein
MAIADNFDNESCNIKSGLNRWLFLKLVGLIMVTVVFNLIVARGLYGRRVRDAGADAALIVDALKVSLAVRWRGALIACRAFFGV